MILSVDRDQPKTEVCLQRELKESSFFCRQFKTIVAFQKQTDAIRRHCIEMHPVVRDRALQSFIL